MTILNIAELPEAARELVPKLGGVVALHGEMGAGKTTLVSALMMAMGSTDDVSSPTFSLVNEYRTATGEPVYHFDFYRIDSPSEALDIGCDEYFDSGALCLVEWPEKIARLLPDDTMHLSIRVEPDGGRTIDVG